MLLIFFSFFLSFQNKIVEIARAQDLQYLQEANDVIISEVALAQKMYADYERTFILPSIADKPYQMNLTDLNEITSYYNGLEYVNFLSVNISGDVFAGNIESGKNTIYRTDGIVYLPDGTVYRNDDYAGFYANVNPETCYEYNYSGTCADLYKINSQFKQFCINFFDLVCPVCPDGVVDPPYEECDDNAAGNHDCWPGGVLNISDPYCHPAVPDPNSADSTFVWTCNTDCQGESVERGCNDDGGWCDQQDVNVCPGNGDANPNNNDCDGLLNMSLSNNEFNFSLDFNANLYAQDCGTNCNYQIVDTQVFNLATSSWESIGPIWPWNLDASIDVTNTLKITGLRDQFQDTCALAYRDANVTIKVSDDPHPITRTEIFNFYLTDCPGCGDGEVQVFDTYSETCDYGAPLSDPAVCIPAYGPATFGGVKASCQYCSPTCQWATNVTTKFCGNDIVESLYGEECDNTSLPEPSPWSLGGTTFCNVYCKNETTSHCGDGIKDIGHETCDLGGTNNNDTPCIPSWGTSCSYCNSVCQEITIDGSSCGDTYCDLGFETCYSCSSDCNNPACASVANLNFFSSNQNEGILLSYVRGEGLDHIDLDWRINNGATSINTINAPFSEFISTAGYGNVVDQSTFNNDGDLGGGSTSNIPTLENSNCLSGLGSCYSFGNGDLIKFNPQEDVRSDFSFSFWVRPTSSFSSLPVVDSSPDSANLFVLLPENQGAISLGTGVAVGTNGAYVFANFAGNYFAVAGGPKSFSDWTFITVVFENNRPYIYANGVPLGTSLSNSLTTFPPRIIGGSSFNGLVDEFRVFDRVLSDSDIVHLYNHYTSRGSSSLKARVQKVVPGETWKVKLTSYDVNGVAIPVLYSNALYIPGCGDGNIDLGEDCDDGFPNPASEVCQTNSNNNNCNFNNPNENFYDVIRTDYSYCNTGCDAGTYSANYYCGDGIKQTSNGETCDYGSYNGGIYCDGFGTTPSYGVDCYTCSSTCQLSANPVNPSCGDGTIDWSQGELCDTGNPADGCCNSNEVAKISSNYYPGCDAVSYNVICDSSISGTSFTQDGLCVCDSSTCSSNSDSDNCYTSGSGKFVCKHSNKYYSGNSGVCSFGDQCDATLTDGTFNYEYSSLRHYFVSLRVDCDSTGNGNTCIDYSTNPSIYACCTDDTTDTTVEKCVTPAGVCVNGFSNSREIISLGGEQAYCYQGTWYDLDSYKTSCEIAPGGHDWLKAGRNSLGEYSDRTSFECCGDDSGEYVIPLSCDADLTCGSADSVCCSSSRDCYLNSNTCYTSGFSAVDVNGDGDDDYCLSGTWYDCETDADCPTNIVCDSNHDCVLAPDGHTCTSDSTCASGYCDNDGVGAADDGVCYTPIAGNNNCNGGNCFDNQDGYCEADTGHADAFADERDSYWVNSNTSSSNYYGCPAHSSCIVAYSPACQAYDGDYNDPICGLVGGTWTSMNGGVDSTDCTSGVTCGTAGGYYCCGDDSNEFIDSFGRYTTGNAGIAINLGSVSACCAADNACIDKDGNCVTYYTGGYLASTQSNDWIAACGGGSTSSTMDDWIDCDYSELRCGFCAGTGETAVWISEGESSTSLPGEYSDGATECCGDDANEYYRHYDVYNTQYGLTTGADNTADDACCNSATDCVYNGRCYSPGYYDLIGSDGVVDMKCHTDGRWLDVDYHSSYCDSAVGTGHWNIGGSATVEDSYYTTNGGTSSYCYIGSSGNPSQQCCCGDDPGELYKNRVCSFRCVTDLTDVSCCTELDDCVYNGVCYPAGTDDVVIGAKCMLGSWRKSLIFHDICGDGICSLAEADSGSCPEDCDLIGPFCGDGSCNNGETCSSCSSDCGACLYCGDGICNNG
ncbi:LamG domain-containing protein, partial [Candidatus Woesearchaeota archaeon]|nr:LamG domain-containing protein [Candidatus Woesearchaeota archaeon]